MAKKLLSTKWAQYLARGSAGASSTSIGGSGKLHLAWKDGHRSAFPLTWLLDHAPEGYHPSTKQRQLDTYSMPRGSELMAQSAQIADGCLQLQWSPRAAAALPQRQPSSSFPLQWLREHCTSDLARELRREHAAAGSGRPRTLWGSDLFAAAESAPTASYEAVQSSQEGLTALLELLHVYGIAVVKNCPLTMAGTQALAQRIGVVRQTLYGGMWATSAEGTEQAHNDTAYTNHALASHTDCTYMTDPPGLQIFNCEAAASGGGGASTYVDGFSVGQQLKQQHPEAFAYFCTTPLRYYCYDTEYHLEAAGPVFELGANGQIMQMRHNDYDRAPLDHLSNADIDAFYLHHTALTELIRAPQNVLRLLLQPGDCVIADNHRTLHGRESFEGRRRMLGCYISKDDAASKARVCGIEALSETV